MGKKYNGVYYHDGASDELIKVLDHARKNTIRVKLLYGDKELNTVWKHSETGYIHVTRSKEPEPVILYSNGKFAGANQIMEQHIVRVEYANKKDGGTLWEYEKQEVNLYV